MASDGSMEATAKSVIGDDLNSTLLFVYSMGIYTSIYIGTLVVYMSRRSQHNRVVTVSLSALYTVTMAQLILQWYQTNFDFVVNGDTRDSILLAYLLNGSVLQLFDVMLTYCGHILANGIMTWRCYHMSDLSLRRIAALLVFLAVESALSVVSSVIQGRNLLKPGVDTVHSERVGFIVDGTLDVVTALNSCLGTYIICKRILSSTSKETHSRRRYIHILRIVIESAVLYSLIVLLFAMGDFLSLLTITSSSVPVFGLQLYVDALAIPITGIAPTLIVAQISLSAASAADVSSLSERVSALNFVVQPTVQNTSLSASETGVLVTGNGGSEMEKESV